MQDNKEKSAHYELTNTILKCCFEVMNTLGSGFLESVYKNALIISLCDMGLKIVTDKTFEVVFKNRKIGLFVPDLIVEDAIILELKCCDYLLPEHQAQLINYLTVTNIRVGLLVNFGKRKLEYKRLYHPAYPAGAADPAYPVSLNPEQALQLN
jgi:GxxExxY protein